MKRVVVEKQEITLPIDAFEKAIHTMINWANAGFGYDLVIDPLRHGIVIFPFDIYRKMEAIQNGNSAS